MVKFATLEEILGHLAVRLVIRVIVGLMAFLQACQQLWGDVKEKQK